MWCPVDLHGCVDDLCYAGTCILLPGVPMLERCMGCGAWIQDGLAGYCDECLMEDEALSAETEVDE